MTQTAARALALRLMARHGLITDGWTLKFTNARKSMGSCRYKTKEIKLSRHHVQADPVEEVTDTILHEIAHALAGAGAGHGPKWKRMAVQVGAKPIRCMSGSNVFLPWKARCQQCRKTSDGGWARKPRANFRCRKCGDRIQVVKMDQAGNVLEVRPDAVARRVKRKLQQPQTLQQMLNAAFQ